MYPPIISPLNTLDRVLQCFNFDTREKSLVFELEFVLLISPGSPQILDANFWDLVIFWKGILLGGTLEIFAIDAAGNFQP